jgi:hypothetical protein
MLDHKVEVWPLGVNLPRRDDIVPQDEHIVLLFKIMKGRRVDFHPKGATSPLGANFCPWGSIFKKNRLFDWFMIFYLTGFRKVQIYCSPLGIPRPMLKSISSSGLCKF